MNQEKKDRKPMVRGVEKIEPPQLANDCATIEASVLTALGVNGHSVPARDAY